jgi:ATP-dependent protease Clp ATPase subunit
VDKCSFCGKSQRVGVRLVRGPEVAICEECVKLAAEVIEGMPEPEQPSATVRLRLFGGSGASGVGPSDADG